MTNFIYKHRFLFLRRITQISLLLLYVSANIWGLNILVGNLSSSLFLDTVPLSDPFAILQMLSAGAILGLDVIIGALIITTFYLIVGGRVFCSWICPVNMITDLSNYIRRKTGLNKIQKKQPATRNMRYWVLGLSFVISFILGVAAFELVSPIGMIHRGIYLDSVLVGQRCLLYSYSICLF